MTAYVRGIDIGKTVFHLIDVSKEGRIVVKHCFTRPYTPRTNSKAERFIQTAPREWAYARSYQPSMEREQQLDLWLHEYNFHRPHASLKLNPPPVFRAGLNRNNLLSLHS
jgi:transposase InsO family protein